jgi:hypothetical protein
MGGTRSPDPGISFTLLLDRKRECRASFRHEEKRAPGFFLWGCHRGEEKTDITIPRDYDKFNKESYCIQE